MTTMREVAASLGVSTITVSRVHRGDPHVNATTRARVEEALRRANYVPNAVARTLRTGKAPVIGIAVPDFLDPFFAAIAQEVARLALIRGMSTVVSTLGEDGGQEPDIVGRLLSQSLSGLIIAPVLAEHTYLEAWSDRLPIVFVDRKPVRFAADSFTEDDVSGARLATQHLIDHGHRRVAFVGDTTELPTTYSRFLGYQAALADNGYRQVPEYTVFGVSGRESAAAIMRELVGLAEPPTAVMSSNARCTMALVPALREHRMALVGFGDFPMADMVEPAVTVIDQDPRALGALAAERVFERLEHPTRRFRRRNVIPVKLVERRSCLVQQ